MARVADFNLQQIKAIATDLDGTALNAHHSLDPQTLEVFRALQERGIKILLATGRPYLDALGLVKSANKDFILPMITSNGAELNHSDPVEDFTICIPEAVVKAILELEFPEHISLNVFTKDQWYSNNPCYAVTKYFTNPTFQYQPLNPNTLDTAGIVKLLFVDASIPEDKKEVSLWLKEQQATLRELFPGLIECVTSQYDCLEVNAANITKAKSIQKYLHHFGLNNKENLLCFGDGMNDIDMLQSAAYGFLMTNASKEVQAICQDLDNITIAGKNIELGVARILNDLFALGLDLEPILK